MCQAEIHLVHAYESPTAAGTIDLPLALPQEIFDRIRETGQRQLGQRVKHVLAVAGLKAQGHLIVDPRTPAILRAGVRMDADLIVMCTQGGPG